MVPLGALRNVEKEHVKLSQCTGALMAVDPRNLEMPPSSVKNWLTPNASGTRLETAGPEDHQGSSSSVSLEVIRRTLKASKMMLNLYT